ncbi:MAG TPA: lipocalin family protein [Chitinophagaceae bacterium]|jgi:hypothetical protein|nr:lipocalin family protein [Chitinophagaceae bacterium]
MKKVFLILILPVVITACTESPRNDVQSANEVSLKGTWKLLSGTLIEKGDTIVTDYTKDRSFIKIINDSHFAFLNHTLRKDTTDFSAGGGTYSLSGNTYTEQLEYCSAKEWEGHDFSFTVTITGDTLIQSGVEKIENEGINRVNIEKYIRVKN